VEGTQKTISGLAPLAIGLVVYAVVVWFLLARDAGLGRWLLGAFLAAHGLVHLLFAVPKPADREAGGFGWPFDLERSWLVTNAGLDPATVRLLGILLVVAVVIGFVLAALSTVGLLVPASLWPGLVVVATAASLGLLAVGFVPGLALGVAIDAVLLWLVVAGSWSPAASPAVG
jgi:hypothetical protein